MRKYWTSPSLIYIINLIFAFKSWEQYPFLHPLYLYFVTIIIFNKLYHSCHLFLLVSWEDSHFFSDVSQVSRTCLEVHNTSVEWMGRPFPLANTKSFNCIMLLAPDQFLKLAKKHLKMLRCIGSSLEGSQHVNKSSSSKGCSHPCFLHLLKTSQLFLAKEHWIHNSVVQFLPVLHDTWGYFLFHSTLFYVFYFSCPIQFSFNIDQTQYFMRWDFVHDCCFGESPSDYHQTQPIYYGTYPIVSNLVPLKKNQCN